MMGPRIWGYGMEFLIELPSNDISGGPASGFSENAEASSVQWSAHPPIFWAASG